MAGIQVKFDVSVISDFVAVAIVLANPLVEKSPKLDPLGPTGKETVNAVLLSVVARQLI
ncbi:hypothetical protein GCM10007100_37550 [Roseibacillus persicicus]|uniref:Uncharacterized protein n=1 Tax=Roseibacillus persicicus TaxID=454148 RepID=A0A918TZQ9_9BACT|nr:hypothetical protein GCM10007100_37550 [Roseibacillus persicicus]